MRHPQSALPSVPGGERLRRPLWASHHQLAIPLPDPSNLALTGNATLLGQFEALYTSSPTATQTTDLTNAYNALASAVARLR